LYATRGSYAFWMDLTDPIDPAELGEDEAPAGSCYDVAVQGDYAYAAEASRGLYVLDVSDPFAPVEVGRTDVPEAALDIVVDGDYAYIGDLSGGLIIFDVSDPTAPVQMGELAFGGGGASGVAVAGDLAYCAAHSNGLQIVDVSDPNAPVLVGQLGGLDYTVNVSLTGDLAVLADFGGGMRVVDVSTPSSPVLLGTFEPTPSDVVWGVDTEGSLALATTPDRGIYLIDISDPSQPTVIDNEQSAGDAFEPFMEDGYVHLADGVTGVGIYRYLDASSAPEGQATASQVLVTRSEGNAASFQLPAGFRTLDVYDPAGRRIFSEELPAGAGRREIEFAARRPGVFFWKAEGKGRIETGRIVLVR
ncbi:MAG: hypothetical protein GF355_05570, partial [Candidatus Eisenbacteria bacterium]|nr:hypothetical protein [Candidatus Eisenbacteria bacterium]